MTDALGCQIAAHIMFRWLRSLGLRDPVETVADRLDQLDIASLPWTGLYEDWRWFSIRPEDVRRLAAMRPRKRSRRGLCVAAMNGSGYVRQAAVRALGHHRHAEAVAFTLWALRDWVPQVRDEAKQSLSRLMTPELAAAFVMQHRLLARLARAQRADLRGTLDRIDQYLRGPQCAPAVEGVLISEDPMVRLYAYRLSADRLRDDVALQARAAADPSPKIRRWFVDRVAEFDAQTGRLWLEKLIHDESFIVVRNVIWNLTPELKQAMWATLLDAACSDQRQIRASVRYSLSDMHSQDFAEVYRKRIAAVEPERVRPGWIEGLGETGTGEDVTDIEQFASSGNSRMRRAALRAIASLDRSAASRRLVDALNDRSSRVRREAVRMLAAAHDDDELDRVFQTLQSSDSELAARAALRVFSRLRGWDAVPAILLAGTRDEHELRDRAAQYAATWMRRHGTYGWTMPVAATQARLVLALDALGRSSHPVPRQYADSWASLVEWAARVCGGKPSDR